MSLLRVLGTGSEKEERQGQGQGVGGQSRLCGPIWSRRRRRSSSLPLLLALPAAKSRSPELELENYLLILSCARFDRLLIHVLVSGPGVRTLSQPSGISGGAWGMSRVGLVGQDEV